jgi:transcriptional regulator GlxA family with amidase domain
VQKALFSCIILKLNQLEGSIEQPSASANNVVPSLVLKAIDYLNLKYAEKITLDDLANVFFVSKGALIYNFKKYTGVSPIDFLLNVRLAKAKEFLLNSKKSVGEISELCGFSSSNYFGLIFKHKEGLSPANYRKHQHTKS